VNALAHARGVHELITVALEPPQRHLNGQFPLINSEPSHGISEQIALSGTGVN